MLRVFESSCSQKLKFKWYNKAMTTDTQQNQIPQETLDELVRRIVEAVHPFRIILFGSAARGQTHPYSDIDVMVVMPDGTHRRKTARKIDVLLGDFTWPVDILVATETDLDLYRDTYGLIYREVVREGREIYDA